MYKLIQEIFGGFIVTLKHAFRPRDTIQYPEQRKARSERFRGRIVLTKDPDGQERCVSCYLCSSVCPVDCIDIQGTEDENERRYPAKFDINFSRCILCGLCEEACPTLAIQLTQDYEFCSTNREKLLYHKEDLLIDGTGKHPDYSFYHHAGVPIKGKAIGDNPDEQKPVDVYTNLP
ncbi:NADH-quinone oxidoreductase subunit NuoI [Shewanella surugensis]|uniref:NADH-quinone oxidoreductase subunit I n=1 Tax=Shewanella surugensis TaxID=212020 RepID=A0ABT0L962_9GAMM|nr:NADH-quinone oxidoreductase subunit NuoI [Shewanella surugensis]MCL1124089.1 NADH-quinone oxidoreductase subunit NuoI [Shewanella surugensis]